MRHTGYRKRHITAFTYAAHKTLSTSRQIYGGGPLSQGVGDELVAKGVSIFSMYGM